MNVYLNYYKENEMHDGDNPPVGIILCAGKNETLVRYVHIPEYQDKPVHINDQISFTF